MLQRSGEQELTEPAPQQALSSAPVPLSTCLVFYLETSIFFTKKDFIKGQLSICPMYSLSIFWDYSLVLFIKIYFSRNFNIPLCLSNMCSRMTAETLDHQYPTWENECSSQLFLQHCFLWLERYEPLHSSSCWKTDIIKTLF